MLTTYENKLILAPMVRIGTLPMRLLALRYGADIVYTEELIDWKFLRSKRRVNDILHTVDYVDQTDGTIVFRTCAEEKQRVVLQLGTCDAGRALKVAKLVENDVAAIDINMGCPKEFSIKGGMGVALLANPDKAYNILKTLVDNVNIPVTCKIRILNTPEATLELVEKLVSSGIKAIAIHGRTRDERPQHAVHPDIINYVAKRISIPVIANGGSKEIEKHSDIYKFKELTGCSSVMLARAAEWNCSIFRKEGLLPMDTVIKDYLKLAVECDNSPSNTKYCVQNILRDLQETPRGRQFLECQTLEQICAIWDLGEYCQSKQSQYQKLGIQGRWQVTPSALEPPHKKIKTTDLDKDVIEKKVCFIRANFNDLNLPKTKLHQWADKNNIKLPNYHTEQVEKLFRTILTFNGKKYTSSFWEKNKKFAEQDILHTVDYVDQTDGTIVFRTCAEEKQRVVLQLGTCDAGRALKVAKLVENDVAAIDINMGCPKEFSIKGGMGVALLANPDKAYNILKTLVDNVNIPVTCKIRILNTPEATLELVEKLVSSGIKAIAIHGRTRDERPQHAVHPDIINYVAKRISIPVIANGGSKEIEKHSDIYKFKELTGCSSVMLARAAEWNCSIFRKEGLLPMDTVIKDYLKLAVECDNSPSNTKYCVQNILRDLQETPRGRQFLECQTLEQICAIWDLGEYCQSKQSQYQKLGIQGRWQVTPSALEPPHKKIKTTDLDKDVIEKKVCFIRANFNDLNLPKTKLHQWADKNNIKLPNYHTEQVEKLFRTILTFNGKKYTSSFWEKNKKFAEQGAALVCLFYLGIVTEVELVSLGSIIK